MMLCLMNGIFLCYRRPFWIFGHKKNSRRKFSRNFFVVVWDDILLQMSPFPALYNFCLGSLLILPAYLSFGNDVCDINIFQLKC